MISQSLNATSTDYKPFGQAGNKMIIYHGWSDAALSAYETTKHYDKARAEDIKLDNYVRLFMLPGVLHCSGGPGPQEADWLGILQQWVENDNPPDKVVLTRTQEGSTIMQRPVYPYPGTAVYKGTGDPNMESSYVRSKND